MKESVKALMIIALIMLILVGCDNGAKEKQYMAEIASLKNEIEGLKDKMVKNDQMQIEINNLKDEIELFKNKKESSLEASVYSDSIKDKDVVVTIDFKKDENDIEKNIYFIILSGNLQGQGVANGYSIARYDEIVIPGRGIISTDDVPKDVTRYQVSFPTRNNYVFNIIAIEQDTGRLWQRELYNNEGDI